MYAKPGASLGECMPEGFNYSYGSDDGIGIGGDAYWSHGYGDDGLGSIFSVLGKIGKGIVNVATTAAGIGPVFQPPPPKTPPLPPVPTMVVNGQPVPSGSGVDTAIQATINALKQAGLFGGATPTGAAPSNPAGATMPGQVVYRQAGISPTMLYLAGGLAVLYLLTSRRK